MRALVVTLGVLLSVAAAIFAAAALSLFVDGESGAGGFATFIALVCLLCAVLLFRTSPRRAAPRQRRQPRPDGGFYYGDSTPTYGYAGTTSADDRRWGGDGGADSGPGHHGHTGHGHAGGWGSDGGADGGSDGGSGGSSGSDGGSGGSDGGGGGSDGGGGGGGD